MILATQLKPTVLHAWHLAHGAKMESFGGYDMPLWYSSAKNEHLSDVLAQLTARNLPTTFWNPDQMILAIPSGVA
jgi:hypothetical protein